MSKELMSDRNLPDPEEGSVQNIMTRNDLRKTVVKITFEPRRSKLAPVRPRRWEFATSVMASDFINTICPPKGQQLGSPKQFRAKVARLLRLTDPSIVANYIFHTELEITGPTGAGDDTGGVEVEDTFVEGAEVEVEEPLNVDDILNSDEETTGSGFDNE